MEEYLRRSQMFQKGLGLTPLSRKEERYLLFRMAGPIMQAKFHRFIDLRQIPQTFIHGNPHIDNYVRTLRGSAMIDFDRSRFGPYSWDIVRFLSSLSLRREENNGFLDRKVVECFIDAYISHFLHQDIPAKSLKMIKNVNPERWQMNSRDYLASNRRWAKKMRENPIRPRSEFAQGLLKKYLESRNETGLLKAFKISEVGEAPGSFGKKHYIYALVPIDPDSHEDSILLDIKEVYAEKNSKYFSSPFSHNGQRMIEASKIFAPGMEERLGYCTFKNVEYWGRQIPSFAIKVKKFLNEDEQCDFAYSVASELAKGHYKGLKNSSNAVLIEKDFTKNFDRYFKISKLFTYELRLAYEAIRRKNRLYPGLSELVVTSYLLLFLLVFLGSLVTSLTGLGGGTLVLAGLMLVYPPEIAVPLHSFNQLAANGIRTGIFFRRVHWKVVAAYASLMLPFAWMAAKVFEHVNPSILKIMVGGFILISVIPWKWKPKHEPHLRTFVIAGAFSGFLGVFVGAVGPLVTPFFNRLKIEREGNLSTKSAGQMLLQLSKIIAFSGAAGFNFLEFKGSVGILFIGSLLGVLVSIPLGKKIPDEKFNLAVDIMLGLISIKVLIEGIRELV